MAKKGGRKDEEKEDEKPSEEEAESSEEDSSADASEEDSSDEDSSDERDEDDDGEDEQESDEDESDEAEDEDEDESEEEAPPKAAKSDDDEPTSSKRTETEDKDEDDNEEGDEDEEDILPAQLGAQRYVYSAFFAATILFGYILGRAFETAWERLAISDWAVDKVPFITSVNDDSKTTYSFLVAGVIAILVALRQFRKEAVRKWAEEVCGELLKVKWPNRKEVYGSTVVVLATSAISVTYLFLLDRFWSFVTNLIYGSPT